MTPKTAVAAAAVQPPPSNARFEFVALDKIVESKTNHRRRSWGDMAGLTESVRQKGVVEPILVRPQAGAEAGFYEIVFGARRFASGQVRYLGRDILLSLPDGRLVTAQGAEPLPLREEILVLHYIEKAKGTPVAGRWISFSEIPGGNVYHPVFLKRCRDPLIKFAGESPEALLPAAAEMGTEPLGTGDVGLKMNPLPCVPLGIVLWRGDEDFPADGNVLLDASVNDYLPLEDTVILAETVVWKLIKNVTSYGLRVTR